MLKVGRPSGSYEDPIAMQLLADENGAPEALGLLAQPSQLGGIFAIAAKAIPYVIQAVDSIRKSGSAVTDPIAAVWQKIPPSAINAYVGPDGWWYDNTTKQRLTHEEAAARQQDVAAAAIGASVGPDGWWYLDATGARLSHEQAWQLYQRLASDSSQGVLPTAPLPFVPNPTTPAPTRPGVPGQPTPLLGAPLIAGVPNVVVYALGAGLLFAIFSGRKGRS